MKDLRKSSTGIALILLDLTGTFSGVQSFLQWLAEPVAKYQVCLNPIFDVVGVFSGHMTVASPSPVWNMNLAASSIGEIVDDRYLLLELLGEGGMGSVFKARELELERDIALKFLQDTYVSDLKVRARFEREANVLASLQHENIVHFYRFGLQEEHRPYIAMELVNGTSVRALMESGKLEPTDALSIALQVCDAMICAHSHEILHRDLKPDNVLLQADENKKWKARIVDFGLARCEPGEGARITTTGAVVGSLHYLSPEQCMGAAVDQRSDIYSLGCMLFEMISGRTIFKADNPMVLINKHVKDPPPLLADVAKQKAIPPGIDQVLQKALAKDPSKRYQSMSELRADLELVATGRASAIEVALPDYNHKFVVGNKLIIASSVAVVGLGLVALAVPRLIPTGPSNQFTEFKRPARHGPKASSIQALLAQARALAKLTLSDQAAMMDRLIQSEQFSSEAIKRLSGAKAPNMLAFEAYFTRGKTRQAIAMMKDDKEMTLRSIDDLRKATDMATSKEGKYYRCAASALTALGSNLNWLQKLGEADEAFRSALKALDGGLATPTVDEQLPLPKTPDRLWIETRLIGINYKMGRRVNDTKLVREHIARYVARKGGLTADVMEAVHILFHMYDQKSDKVAVLDEVSQLLKKKPSQSRGSMADIYAILADLELEVDRNQRAFDNLMQAAQYYSTSSRENTITTRHISSIAAELKRHFPEGSKQCEALDKCTQSIQKSGHKPLSDRAIR